MQSRPHPLYDPLLTPSSHTSPRATETMPSPQTGRLHVVMQVVSGPLASPKSHSSSPSGMPLPQPSMRQNAEHWTDSPFSFLQSEPSSLQSHCSCGSRIPFRHVESWQFWHHDSAESHISPASIFPFPQKGFRLHATHPAKAASSGETSPGSHSSVPVTMPSPQIEAHVLWPMLTNPVIWRVYVDPPLHRSAWNIWIE